MKTKPTSIQRPVQILHPSPPRVIMAETKERLRMISYLVPSIPVELFELLLEYLEGVTGRQGYLIYESRWTGPPQQRVDPFTSNEVDIGLMSSTDYLRLVSNQNKHISLCEAGAVFNHTKNTERPVYFADVIIHARNKLKYKDMHDLRGHSLGFAGSKSISSCLAVLDYLKKQGFDVSFFGSTFECGSHIGLINSVLANRVDVASVDSNALFNFLKTNPSHKDDLQVITSFGPLPTYPIVLNSRMPDALKTQITQGLLDMAKDSNWRKRLEEFNINGFVPIDSSLYVIETDLASNIGKLKMNATYY
ncbi:uncharacterized protein LOC127842769 isoform X2 [Dreissena polymorpha]|uniref:uncharacterized protein LOC127842769 isoform X2 n=1 Tax=Dreissena polymorpha TaxID=45954 RepID=UPI0022641516|nr:uncharacterized protein LOC127842769 isoform X2 [Dreissena polymorpha]